MGITSWGILDLCIRKATNIWLVITQKSVKILETAGCNYQVLQKRK